MKIKPRKRNDLEFYDRRADRWWQPNEKIYTLSYLNSPRFTFFDSYVKDWQGFFFDTINRNFKSKLIFIISRLVEINSTL
jgi:hypothetical protein